MKTMFEFYCYCERHVKHIDCWIQEWLLDWEGGPPYLYWWMKGLWIKLF